MTSSVTPSRKRLLLAGGGHAHLFVLEKLAQTRSHWEGRLDPVLVSRDPQLVYSGMLPGLVAGHYRPSECRIDLEPLARRAGIPFVQAEIGALDLVRNIARAGERSIEFDLLSLDVGGLPGGNGVPGADLACGVRPVPRFLERWRELQSQIEQVAHPVHVVIAGGGAGGAELALAMAYRMAAQRSRVKWSLVTRGPLLPGYPRRAAVLLERHLAEMGVAVRADADIVAVEPGRLMFRDGSSGAFDMLWWATGVAAPAWVAASGLACVDGGFVEVDDSLRSVSHPHVFAAGDIASNPHQPRPKAGVFAVRQGPVLADNLLRQVAGDPLSTYLPQSSYLSLLATGPRHAIAAWNGLSWQGEWVWRWKDRIDRRFIERFSPSVGSPAPADSRG